MNIKEKFLSLTSRTYPHGTEGDILHLLPADLKYDEFGNRYKVIGENPTAIFASHLDTATSANTKVKHVIDGNIIKTDGTSILGADDKAGVVIMLYMMEHGVEGMYYFFLGEEVGCLGSRKVAADHKILPLEGINKVISFDRRGTKSVITHQMYSRCCSDDFATALGNQLNKLDKSFSYANDSGGLYTDSAQFTKIYAECTNISVGYQHEHTFTEQQDIDHLEKLAKACVLVDWNSLPVKRDPSVSEYLDYGYSDYGYYNYTPRNIYNPNTYSGGMGSVSNYRETINFVDTDFGGGYLSSIIINKYTSVLLGVEFSDDRIETEKLQLEDLMDALEVSYKMIEWDGFTMRIHGIDGTTQEANRNDLSEYFNEFDFWREHLLTHRKEQASKISRSQMANAGWDEWD